MKKFIHSYTFEFHVYSNEWHPRDVPVDELVKQLIHQANTLNDADFKERIDCFESIDNPDSA